MPMCSRKPATGIPHTGHGNKHGPSACLGYHPGHGLSPISYLAILPAGLGYFVKDFVAKATGTGDLYQQGWREASADKAAAFERWNKFQQVASRKFGLQSGEHVQWHIGAAVAQRFGKFRQRFPLPSTGTHVHASTACFIKMSQQGGPSCLGFMHDMASQT